MTSCAASSALPAVVASAPASGALAATPAPCLALVATPHRDDPTNGGHIVQVLPHLFLGNAAAAVNQDLLRAHGITHVVTAAVGDGVGALFPDQFLYHEVCIEDSSGAALLPHLGPACDFIQAAMATEGDRPGCLWCGGAVLVHCVVGTSRSVAIVLAFLVGRRGFTLRSALLHVMGQRAASDAAAAAAAAAAASTTAAASEIMPPALCVPGDAVSPLGSCEPGQGGGSDGSAGGPSCSEPTSPASAPCCAMHHARRPAALPSSPAPYTHPNRGFMKELIALEVEVRGEASLSLAEYMRELSTGKNLPHGTQPVSV